MICETIQLGIAYYPKHPMTSFLKPYVDAV